MTNEKGGIVTGVACSRQEEPNPEWNGGDGLLKKTPTRCELFLPHLCPTAAVEMEPQQAEGCCLPRAGFARKGLGVVRIGCSFWLGHLLTMGL